MQRKDAHDEQHPIAERLRAERPQIDPLRLDQIKTTAMSRAGRSGRSTAGRRLVIAGLTVGLMAATTGGVIAAGGAGQSGGNAATAQYGHGVKKHKRPTGPFHIHLKIPANIKLKSVTISFNGKTVLVLTGSKVTRNITVTLPCGPGIVKIVVVTNAGQVLTGKRVLPACGTSSRQRRAR